MSGLIAAAKKEGQLNVIALPPDWANYGAIISGFTAKYGIKVNSANPNGSSQDEVNAVREQGGTSRAPDVLDIGMAVALANTALFAPYEVAEWNDIPAGTRTTVDTCRSATTRASSRSHRSRTCSSLSSRARWR
jgi:putative spermidine/putrescine transport system substrate-binding protein